MSTWHCEIHWLGSETKTRSGDCIILRWGDDLNDPDRSTVAVIDAGRSTKDAGRLTTKLEQLNVGVVDYLIGTHSDADHISQFKTLLDNPDFGFSRLWLLNPYDHMEAYEPLTVAASATHVDQTVRHPQVANGNVEQTNPRPGTATEDGCLQIVGPSRAYYLGLLPKIFTQEQLADAKRESSSDLAAFAVLAAEQRADFDLQQAKTAAARAAAEPSPDRTEGPTWAEDELGSGLSDATNNASLIMLFTRKDNGHQYLFTGDAGVPAFDSADGALASAGFDRSKLRIFQMPHHGSRGNVSVALLDRLLGNKITDRDEAETAVDSNERTAFAMCGKSDPHHASGRATDALFRRGWAPYTTNSSSIVSHRWTPPGETPTEPTPSKVVGFGDNPKDR